MYRPRPARAAGSFEYMMWIFTRVSGLVLMLLGAFNLAMAFMMRGRTYLNLPEMFRWMFFPNPNHVINSDIPDITVGWSNAFWQIYGIAMIALATIHGLNGLRMIIEDFLDRPLLTAIVRVLLVGLLVGGMIVATYVILAS